MYPFSSKSVFNVVYLDFLRFTAWEFFSKQQVNSKKTDSFLISVQENKIWPAYLVARNIRGKLFGGTVPPNNTLFGRTVPRNKTLFGGKVPPNSTLFGKTPDSEKTYLICLKSVNFVT